MISEVSISIINLCFNTGSRIMATLDSIKNQTFKKIEIIIVDDGSIDNSIELISNWIENNSSIKTRLIENKKNIGIIRSLNKALKYCEGEYISMIGDDIWYPNLLEREINILLKSNENIALIYSKCNCYDVVNKKNLDDLNPKTNLNIIGYSHTDKLFKQTENTNVYQLQNPWLNEILLKSNLVIGFNCIIKKNILIEKGGFDENYQIEDYPLWLKLSSSYEFLFLDEIHGCYMRYSKNFSTNNNYEIDYAVLTMLVNSYNKKYKLDILFDLQNRILTIIIDLYKYSNKQKNSKIRRAVLFKLFKFLNWPNLVTYKYFFKKFTRKINKKVIAKN